MPPLPEAIILVLAPFAPLFSHRTLFAVWLHAQLLLLGAMLAPCARTVTGSLRVVELATERRFTNDHRVVNRATWSAHQGSRVLLGVLITCLVSPGATIVRGAADTHERRRGRTIAAQGCDRDAVHSSTRHVIRCFGVKWVSMMLLVLVPWSRRVWALPCLTALSWPADQDSQRRHKTSIDGVRQLMKQVRRWLPERQIETPINVKAIRKQVGMTQTEFAAAFGISLSTLRHWERGDRIPRGPARVLLHVVAKAPRAVLKALATPGDGAPAPGTEGPLSPQGSDGVEPCDRSPRLTTA